MAAGAPDGVASRVYSFRLAGRLVRRRGASTVQAEPKHGRCGRAAGGRRRGVSVGRQAVRGGGAAIEVRPSYLALTKKLPLFFCSFQK